MPYLAVKNAIRKRFATAHEFWHDIRIDDPCNTGNSPTYTPLDTEVPECPPLTWFLLFKGGFRDIRVFEEDAQGHDVDHWPNISFRHVRDRPRPEEAYWNGTDRDCLGCTTGVDSLGNIVKGPDLIRERRQAQPKSLIYEFWIESIDLHLGYRLLSMVTELFPSQGILEIQRNDGSRVHLDMLENVPPFRSRGFDPTLAGGDPGVRFYRWTAIYLVEAYADNTLQGKWRQTIRSHCEDATLLSEVGLISEG